VAGLALGALYADADAKRRVPYSSMNGRRGWKRCFDKELPRHPGLRIEDQSLTVGPPNLDTPLSSDHNPGTMLRTRKVIEKCVRRGGNELDPLPNHLVEVTFAAHYFLKVYDLIPDNTPEIGLADDYAVLKRVMTRNRTELDDIVHPPSPGT
jgi:hypothetical protein